jgi:hypothetical protein
MRYMLRTQRVFNIEHVFSSYGGCSGRRMFRPRVRPNYPDPLWAGVTVVEKQVAWRLRFLAFPLCDWGVSQQRWKIVKLHEWTG